MSKAPFGRMGGKSKIAKELIFLFPKNYKIYVEPFVGAGNVFFRKPINGEIEIINDLDPIVFQILKGLKNRTAYINDNMNRYITREDFNKALKKKDVISRLITIKASFFAMGLAWIGKDIKIMANFMPYKERLKNVTILNESFEKVIKDYDSINTFFYLDPPYESENEKDYSHYVTPEQVYNAISKIKGKFMITYNNSQNIRKMFKEFKIREIETSYSNTHYIERRKKIELIITNY